MFKKILNSYWFPGIIILGLFGAYELFRMEFVPTSDDHFLFFVVFGIASIYVFTNAIINLTRKKWKLAMVQGLVLPLCLYVILVQSIAIFFSVLGEAENDQFAKNLKIPEGIEISEPRVGVLATADIRDYLLEKIIEVQSEDITSQVGNETKVVTVPIDLSRFTELKKLPDKKDLLLEYFARSPQWYVQKDRRGIFAFRRFKIQDKYLTSLHGYYSTSDFGMYEDKGGYFQFRLGIGFQNKTWSMWSDGDTEFKFGKKGEVNLGRGNDAFESRILIREGEFHIELFEQNKTRTRRISSLALAWLNDLAKNFSEIEAIGEKRESNFEISNNMQPGIYELQYWINPGEPGFAYLKAFEITKGTPLSEERMKSATIERVGWSKKTDETFYGNSIFTIYEGNWGEYYGARLELWFSPASGGPDRKLLEKNYRVQGWMR